MKKFYVLLTLCLLPAHVFADEISGLSFGLTKYSVDMTNPYMNGTTGTSTTADYLYIPFGYEVFSEDDHYELTTFSLNALIGLLFLDSPLNNSKGMNTTSDGKNTVLSSELKGKETFYFVDTPLLRLVMASSISDNFPLQAGVQFEIGTRGIFPDAGRTTSNTNITDATWFDMIATYSVGLNLGYTTTFADGLLNWTSYYDWDYGGLDRTGTGYQLESIGNSWLNEVRYFLPDSNIFVKGSYKTASYQYLSAAFRNPKPTYSYSMLGITLGYIY
ncbi:MAG: hypothetical protein R8M14_04540 [Ghiorsea sp.]